METLQQYMGTAKTKKNYFYSDQTMQHMTLKNGNQCNQILLLKAKNAH